MSHALLCRPPLRNCPPPAGLDVGGQSKEQSRRGMGFLLREEVAFTVRADSEDQHVEAQWVEIHRDRLPSILCCSVYIPPRDSKALEGLEAAVQRAKHKHRLVLTRKAGLGQHSAVIKSNTLCCMVFELQLLHLVNNGCAL